MNIIFLLSRDTWGPEARYVLDLSRYLKDEGNKVCVITRNIDEITEPFSEAGIRHVTAPLRGGFDIISPVTIGRRLRDAGKTVIHVQKFRDAAIADKARTLSGNRNVKIVITVRTARQARLTAAHRAVYRAIDGFIFPSETARNLFMSSMPGIPDSKIMVIPDTVLVPRSSSTVTPVKGDDRLTLMMHSELTADCGLDVILSMMHQLQTEPLRLVVIGKGVSGEVMPLIREARKAGIDSRIEWKGEKVNPHDIIPEADLGLVMDRETRAGNSRIVEFMAHGIPVIATDNATTREAIVDGRDGRLVAADNVYALAQTVLDLLENPALRRTMGEAARHKFDSRHRFPDHVATLMAIYNA